MTLGWKKVGILAAVATVLMLFAAVRPGMDTQDAEALAAPGGISVLPSGVPAIPGVANQGFPGVIGTGQSAIVTVFCNGNTFFPGALPVWGGNCPESDVVIPTGQGRITFELERVFPDGDAAATFAASGSDTLVVTDSAVRFNIGGHGGLGALGGGDMDAAMGVVAVQVNAAAATTGGTKGVNEILNVRATDEQGSSLVTQIVVVESLAAWGPTGPISTATQEQPIFVSYRCAVNGRSSLAAGTAGAFMEAANTSLADAGGDGNQGLDDMYDLLYGPNAFLGPFFGSVVAPGAGFGTSSIGGDADINDVWCGGNTGGLFDDGVTFQTDRGIFDVSPVAGAAQIGASQAGANLPPLFYPAGVDTDCSSGKNINVRDTDALNGWWQYFNYPLADHEVGCDLDGWRNSVVTTELLGTGEVGVATISAQQGGGIGTPQTTNVTFVGAGAAALFLGIDAPGTIGITGADFTVTLTDQDLRPVGNETVECTISPASAGLAVLPANGTTGAITSDNPGQVTMHVIPTGSSVLLGEEITLTCVLVSNRDVSASTTINLSLTPDTELVDLVDGCQIVTPTEALATTALRARFDPEYNSAWVLDPSTGTWAGDSPSAGAAGQGPNDLTGVERLEGFFACMPEGGGTFERAVL